MPAPVPTRAAAGSPSTRIMPAARVIARLDVKGPNLVKGIHLEGLRVIGDPSAYAARYYAEGADEILYVDIVASLYGRNNIPVSYTHLRAHETPEHLVCRLLLEKKN